MAKIKFEKKLENQLNEVQKKSRVRTITMDDIRKELELIEEAWCFQHSKKSLEDVTIKYNPNAQSFPNAYNGTPEATILEASFLKGGWECSVKRGVCTNTELASSEKELPNIVSLYFLMRRFEKSFNQYYLKELKENK